VLAVAQIIGSLIVLGLFSQLNRPAVILLNAAIGLIQIALWRVPLARACKEISRSLVEMMRAALNSPATMIALVALVLSMLFIAWLGIILPPTDWDGLAQNLPMAVFHIQEGNIKPIETPYRGIKAYPQGGALLLAYTILLTGNDTLVDLVQFPFWLLGTLAVFAVARELGAGRSASFLGALLFAAAPVTILQARAAYFDLELAAISLASLALALDREIDTVWRSLIVGVGMGIVVGLKYAGIIYAFVLFVILIALMVYDRIARKTLMISLIGIGVACIGLGGYWYILNIAYYQNPFWPMQLQLGDIQLLGGVWTTREFYQEALPPSIAHWPYLFQILTIWHEMTGHYAADMRLGGLGPLWFALGLPGLTFFAVQTFRRPSAPNASVLFFLLTTFLLTPANWHTRYVLAPVGVAGACIAIMIEAMSGSIRQALSWTTAVLAVLTLMMVPAHGEARPTDVVRNAFLPSELHRTAFMDQVPTMDEALRWAELNITAGSTIAYGWGGVILYPLFGPDLQNRLIYVKPSTGGFSRKTVEGKCPEYVIARTGSVEEAIARQDSAVKKIFVSDKYAVFRVIACE